MYLHKLIISSSLFYSSHIIALSPILASQGTPVIEFLLLCIFISSKLLQFLNALYISFIVDGISIFIRFTQKPNALPPIASITLFKTIFLR